MKKYRYIDLFRGQEPYQQADLIAIKFNIENNYMIIKIKANSKTTDLHMGSFIDKERYKQLMTIYDAPIIFNSDYIDLDKSDLNEHFWNSQLFLEETKKEGVNPNAIWDHRYQCGHLVPNPIYKTLSHKNQGRDRDSVQFDNSELEGNE